MPPGHAKSSLASPTLGRIRTGGIIPRHVAIIMDGNGRWAAQRGLPRTAGHRAGMKAVKEAIEGSVEAGVGILTLFAFSIENWQRPLREIRALMTLLASYADRERDELQARGVEVRVLGDLDRLDKRTLAAVERIVEATRQGSSLRVNLMISYSGREEILRAVRELAGRVAVGRLEPSKITEEMFEEELFTCGLPDPDLLIRTSGESRVSNFLLWQLAYTEIHITPVLWPDFDRETLFSAIADFQSRDRRFGRLSSR